MVDEQTYDVHFQFEQYYFTANKVDDDEVGRWRAAFAVKRVFDVEVGNTHYTVNPDQLAYMRVSRHQSWG